ncbi:MAG: uroporphyrinogen-III C-methyltransferase [Armatimonadota bacterium]|nr:uroporphyrinogen-III C-methyltransferase [Armatimonadota bacterium]
MSNSSYGKVYLVGAGPGDPKLCTLKAVECIQKADVIVYDRLAHPALLKHAQPDVELIYVGKASSDHAMRQEDINHLLADKAKEGKIVTRLKGGDPFVFGRGGEEAELLVEEGVSFEVVPGITSAIAVPAYAGIPVTHRKLCSTLGIITGHEDPNKTESSIKWDKIATGIDTLVFLMGVENLPNIVSELVKNGRATDTPIALVRWGTRTNQETLVGTLGDIVEKVQQTGFKSPAVTIVGEVVRLRDTLRWFDNRPLFGKKVVVTRSREQASELTQELENLGAEVIEFPVIKIVPPADWSPVDTVVEGMASFDWLIFTSANGVNCLVKRLLKTNRDIRVLAGPKIAAIGPKTAETLEKFGVRVDFIPDKFVAEAVIDQFPEDVKGKRILLARAGVAREVLPEKLTELGADVTVVIVYETVLEDSDSADIKQMLDDGEIDIITFTSSSTVKNFVALIGENGKSSLPEGVTIACIGPITAQTAEEYGLKPDIIADEYTIEGLVHALVDRQSNITQALDRIK